MKRSRGFCVDCGTPSRRPNARCRACFVVFVKAEAERLLPELFWAKVDQRGPDECWPWIAGLDEHGYGHFSRLGRSASSHRTAYELSVRAIPAGLTIDHLCRNRACQNPKHMEPVTRGDNVLRGEAPTAKFARRTHCVRGHEYTPENTAIRKKFRGTRRCLACQAMWNAITNAKAKQKRAAA